MYKNFTLTESEREEILNRHKDHGYRQPLNEQSYSSSKGTKLPARYMPLYDRLSEVNILNVSKNDTSVRWDTDNSKYHVIFMVSLNDPILGISVNDSKSPDSFGYRLEKELMSYWTKKGYNVYDPGGIVQLVNKPIPDVTLDLIKFFRKYPLDLKGFSSEGKPTKPNPKWKVISEYLKNNMINGFKFVGFIEDISSQGAEMKNNKGQELVVDPNGNWTIYSSGSGNSKGTWKWDGSKVIMGSPQPITGVSQSNIGSSKPINEQGVKSIDRNISKQLSGQTTVNANWDMVSSSLMSTKPKVIRMKDDMSLNWGSHSGPNYDWGLSISKMGTFVLQGPNVQKIQKALIICKKYGVPLYSEDSDFLMSDKITSLPTDKVISFVKELLVMCNQSVKPTQY